MTSVVEIGCYTKRYGAARKATFGLLSAFVLLVLVAGCQGDEAALQFSGKTMGTHYNVTVVPEGEDVDAGELQRLVDEQLEAVNQSMSTYIADSELNQLNAAPVGEWVEISEPLHSVLLTAMEVSWLSAGAFDVTVGPLVDLWGFGPPGRDDTPPSAVELAEVRKWVGFQHIELDLQHPRVRKLQPVRIDLSAIAKGYGVDVVAESLSGAGLTNFLVEIGGELRLAGHSPRGTPWRVAIERPDAMPGQVQQAVTLTDVGLATSGDYRNYFEQDGKRFSHTIDPTSGAPVTHALASVSVVAENAAYADALATALEVLGPEKARRLAEQQGLAVFLIIRKGDEFVTWHSDAFTPYLGNSAGESR